MKYKNKLTKIAGSRFLLVPSIVRKNLDLKDGDILEVTIEKINDEEVQKKYRCKLCNHLFFLDSNEIPYCSICNEEGDNIEEVIENDK